MDLKSKDEVNYRFAGSPVSDHKADEPTVFSMAHERCEHCTSFHDAPRNMGSCDKVFGTVTPRFVCNLFEEKHA